MLFLVQGNPDATVFVASAVAFLFGTMILLCLFVPKLLYQRERNNAKGSGTTKISGLQKPEKVDSMMGNTSGHTNNESSSSNLEEVFSNKSPHDLAMENAALKKRILELEDKETNLPENGSPLMLGQDQG